MRKILATLAKIWGKNWRDFIPTIFFHPNVIQGQISPPKVCVKKEEIQETCCKHFFTLMLLIVSKKRTKKGVKMMLALTSHTNNNSAETAEAVAQPDTPHWLVGGPPCPVGSGHGCHPGLSCAARTCPGGAGGPLQIK